jgi:hypothetical protein
VAYGIDIQERDDPFVEAIEEANAPFSTALVPGTYLVVSNTLLVQD